MNKDNISEFTLHDLDLLIRDFESIKRIYLFGSRRYPNQSLRSDIDLLIESSAFIKPQDLRAFINRNPVLDLFSMEGGQAVSYANESCISYSNQEDLLNHLNAVQLWDRDNGYSTTLDIEPIFEYRNDIEFKMTCLPETFLKPENYDNKLIEIESQGLPIEPIIGENINAAADFLVKISERMIFEKIKFTKSRGQSKNSWVNNLKSEYDFQDLFEIICKPFIPNLAREEVSIIYDGSKKLSDFSFFNSQIIIEMKHIKDTGSANNTVKTLSGLKDFYKQNSNIKVLLFIIYVEKNVDLDIVKWEKDFSILSTSPKVITKVIRNT